MSSPPQLRYLTTTALVLVSLTLLAGCSASALPGLGPSQPYETPLNASEVEAGHARVLDDAGSATIVMEMNVTSGGRPAGTGNLTVETEFENGPTHATTGGSGATTEVYVAEDGTGYSRVAVDGGVVHYDILSDSMNVSSFTELDPGEMTDRFEFTVNGTAEIDGETTYVYEARNASGLDPLPGESTLDDVSIRLYIRSDGLVKRMAIRTGSADDSSFSMTQTYYDVGETTVEEPSWLDDAKDATAS